MLDNAVLTGLFGVNLLLVETKRLAFCAVRRVAAWAAETGSPDSKADPLSAERLASPSFDCSKMHLDCRLARTPQTYCGLIVTPSRRCTAPRFKLWLFQDC
jgi:hypothetical protein